MKEKEGKEDEKDGRFIARIAIFILRLI